jgi:hypothetical protein
VDAQRTATAAQATSDSSLELARALGRAEGERFDDRLRAREGQAREERLGRQLLVAGDDDPGLQPGASGAADPRLVHQIEELRRFHAAVIRSRGWRLLQALRRPFGRAW